MSESIKLENDIYWDTKSVVHNKQALNDFLNNFKVTCMLITGLSLDAGVKYQLTLPENTIFVEPLLESYGSDYSGGSFVVPGGGYSYLTNTSYMPNSSYKGIYVSCNISGLIDISSYRHCGAQVHGFRIWYLKKI